MSEQAREEDARELDAENGAAPLNNQSGLSRDLSRQMDQFKANFGEVPLSPASQAQFQAQYQIWLQDLHPRTCLLVHWLADLGAVPEPGKRVRRQARRFAERRLLLGRIVERERGQGVAKALDQLGSDIDIYTAWVMWLRFAEYVPPRFVLPGGREKVLGWVRRQLRRPELTSSETLGELFWQADRLTSTLDKPNPEGLPKFYA